MFRIVRRNKKQKLLIVFFINVPPLFFVFVSLFAILCSMFMRCKSKINENAITQQLLYKQIHTATWINEANDNALANIFPCTQLSFSSTVKPYLCILSNLLFCAFAVCCLQPSCIKFSWNSDFN